MMYSMNSRPNSWSPVLKRTQLQVKEVDDFIDSLLDEKLSSSPPMKKTCWDHMSRNSEMDGEIWNWTGINGVDQDSAVNSYLDFSAIGPGVGFAQPFWASPIPPPAVKGAPPGSSPLRGFSQNCLNSDQNCFGEEAFDKNSLKLGQSSLPEGEFGQNFLFLGENRFSEEVFDRNSLKFDQNRLAENWFDQNSSKFDQNCPPLDACGKNLFKLGQNILADDEFGNLSKFDQNCLAVEEFDHSSLSVPECDQECYLLDPPPGSNIADINLVKSKSYIVSESSEGPAALNSQSIASSGDSVGLNSVELGKQVEREDEVSGDISWCADVFCNDLEGDSEVLVDDLSALNSTNSCSLGQNRETGAYLFPSPEKTEHLTQNLDSSGPELTAGSAIFTNEKPNPNSETNSSFVTSVTCKRHCTCFSQTEIEPSDSPCDCNSCQKEIKSATPSSLTSEGGRPVNLLERLAAVVKSKTTEKLNSVEGTGLPLPSAEKVVRRIVSMAEKRRSGGVESDGVGLKRGADSGQAIVVRRRFQSTDDVLKTRLLRLAEDTVTSDVERAAFLRSLLQEEANPFGTVMQRIVHYFLKGLHAREKGNGNDDFLRPLELTPSEMGAIQDFSSRTPFLSFSKDFINDSILEAVGNKPCVHIVDLSMWIGQWGPLIRSLSKRVGGPPFVRITGVESPVGVPCGCGPRMSPSVINMEIMMIANECGVRCEFSYVTSRLENLKGSDLKLRKGEVLAVAGVMRLQQLPDGSVVRSNPRDNFLKKVRSWNPQTVVLCDPDSDQNSPFFLSRFKEAVDHYTTIFDFFDAVASRDCPERKIFEEKIFGREISHVISMEGLQRVQRSERLSMVQNRMRKCGYVSKTVNEQTVKTLREKASQINADLSVNLKNSGLQLTWKGRSFMAAHSWN